MYFYLLFKAINKISCLLKKITAISLLLLFIFNFIGYKFWFDYQQQKAGKEMNVSIDKHQYNEDELITLQIPITVPYQTEFQDYERVEGEINIDGIIYKYVKRKIENGQIILKCLPDHQKMQVLSGRDAFSKLANDFEQFTTAKHSNHKIITAYKPLVYDFKEDTGIGFLYTASVFQYKINNNNSLPYPFAASRKRPPNKVLA